MKKNHFILATLLNLVAPTLSHAAQITCPVVSPEYQLPFGNASKLSSFTILHTAGQAPLLKTEGNIDLVGHVERDEATGAYKYRFRSLYMPRNRRHCPMICGNGVTTMDEIVWLFYFDQGCSDTRDTLTVEIGPNAAQSKAMFTAETRVRPEVLTIPMPGLTAGWHTAQNTTVALPNCDIR